jgi:hypothetical protein
MRIAYLAVIDGNANGFYRAVGPMDHLAHRGHEVRQLAAVSPRERFALVRDVDVLHVHRYCDAQHTLPLMREAKAHGAAVVWDDDDDLGAMPRSNPNYKRFGGLAWQRRLKAMQEIFAMADLVTATNPTLAGRFGEYGARRTAVIENYIPGLFLQPRDRATKSGVTIGWVAGREHQLDREELPITATLARLLAERPDVNVVSIGLRLPLESPRYERVGAVNVLRLADVTSTFDVGIAPLADHAFNRAKSNVKVKEYAAGGAAWLASPVGPYAGLGEKQGGRLVADDRWHEQLTRLLDRPRERAKLAKRASKWAAGETLERNAHRWEQAFSEAIDGARGQGARSASRPSRRRSPIPAR